MRFKVVNKFTNEEEDSNDFAVDSHGQLIRLYSPDMGWWFADKNLKVVYIEDKNEKNKK